MKFRDHMVEIGFVFIFALIIFHFVVSVSHKLGCVEACKQDGRNTFECKYVICERLQ